MTVIGDFTARGGITTKVTAEYQGPRISNRRRVPGRRMDDEVVRLPVEDAIDLHAFAPADIVSVVDEYLRAAQRGRVRDCPANPRPRQGGAARRRAAAASRTPARGIVIGMRPNPTWALPWSDCGAE